MKTSTFIKGVARMSKKDKQKSEAIKDAEVHGGETYNSEASTKVDTKQLAADACPDCKAKVLKALTSDRKFAKPAKAGQSIKQLKEFKSMFILEDAAVTGDSAPAVNPNAGAAEPEGGLPPNDPNGEGTTPGRSR
jgi:hypothetical protein